MKRGNAKFMKNGRLNAVPSYPSLSGQNRRASRSLSSVSSTCSVYIIKSQKRNETEHGCQPIHTHGRHISDDKPSSESSDDATDWTADKPAARLLLRNLFKEGIAMRGRERDLEIKAVCVEAIIKAIGFFSKGSSFKYKPIIEDILLLCMAIPSCGPRTLSDIFDALVDFDDEELHFLASKLALSVQFNCLPQTKEECSSTSMPKVPRRLSGSPPQQSMSRPIRRSSSRSSPRQSFSRHNRRSSSRSSQHQPSSRPLPRCSSPGSPPQQSLSRPNRRSSSRSSQHQPSSRPLPRCSSPGPPPQQSLSRPIRRSSSRSPPQQSLSRPLPRCSSPGPPPQQSLSRPNRRSSSRSPQRQSSPPQSSSQQISSRDPLASFFPQLSSYIPPPPGIFFAYPTPPLSSSLSSPPQSWSRPIQLPHPSNMGALRQSTSFQHSGVPRPPVHTGQPNNIFLQQQLHQQPNYEFEHRPNAHFSGGQKAENSYHDGNSLTHSFRDGYPHTYYTTYYNNGRPTYYSEPHVTLSNNARPSFNHNIFPNVAPSEAACFKDRPADASNKENKSVVSSLNNSSLHSAANAEAVESNKINTFAYKQPTKSLRGQPEKNMALLPSWFVKKQQGEKVEHVDACEETKKQEAKNKVELLKKEEEMKIDLRILSSSRCYSGTMSNRIPVNVRDERINLSVAKKLQMTKQPEFRGGVLGLDEACQKHR